MIMDTLPGVPFGPHRISRLIVGGNPFRGNSHQTAELSAEMQEYYTQEQMIRTLFECERQGLTAMQSRGDQIIMDMVRAYREQGGKLHWIVQTATELGDIMQNIRDIAQLEPIAIYNHGTDSDQRFREGTTDVICDRLKLIQDLGLLAGFCSHIPEAFYWVEEQGWPVDFYMTCFYNIAKIERQSIYIAGEPEVCQEPYDDPDRDVICEFIRQTDKPCLAYKILAAGRKCHTRDDVRAAFKYAFDNIKPTDAVVVGIFDKYENQVAINAQIVRELGG